MLVIINGVHVGKTLLPTPAVKTDKQTDRQKGANLQTLDKNKHPFRRENKKEVTSDDMYFSQFWYAF